MDPKLSISVTLTIFAFVLTIYLSVVAVMVQQDEAAGVSHSVTVDSPVQPRKIEHPGEKVFNANCKACHRVHQKLIGPALAGVLERRDSLWVVRMIRNSSQLIASGDPTAVQLFKDYNRTQMTAFTTMSDEDLRALLNYLKLESEAVSNL
jgi:mono/diheme cytochrome c family protein